MADELIDVLDENGNQISDKMKSEVHKDGDWHKGAHIWIIIGKKILLQKRSYKKVIFPRRFDVACAGHVKSREDYEDAAVRELKEELGIETKKDDLILIDSRPQITLIKEKNIISKEILRVFLLEIHNKLGDLIINKDEILELKLFSIEELRTFLMNKPEMFIDDKKYFFDTIDKIEKYINKIK